MKTLKKQVEEVLQSPITGTPEEQQRIRRLEEIVIKLAQHIDNNANHIIG